MFAPAGELVPIALEAVRPGGTVSLAGIHMSPIPSFDYALLWRERSLRSVANMTRARRRGVHGARRRGAHPHAEITTFPLEAANEALAAIKADSIRGAAVLDVAVTQVPARKVHE